MWRRMRAGMLSDPRAVEIISKAKQKNVASPKRSDRDFDHIFKDFFIGFDFRNQLILDLGPGQFEFAKRVRERGGVVHNLDFDPAVLELGRYLGFDVFEANFKEFDPEPYRGRYDGLFCKFSINAFWFEADQVRLHIRELDSMLKPGGWGWVAPWNGLMRRDERSVNVRAHLARQTDAFTECGWTAFDVDEQLARYYGVHGAIENHALFVKGVPSPPSVVSFRVKLTNLKARVSEMVLR